MQKLPDWLWAERLTPISFYRYRSSVRDRFYEIDSHDGNPDIICRFNDIKTKCMNMQVNVGGSGDIEEWRSDVWDNKVAIECLTERGNKVFIGCYDGVWSVGLGVDGDKWIKPWPYRKAA